MPPCPRISLVLPARNEADLIEDTLREVTSYLDGLGSSYEVIVGDSGSHDGTRELVERLALPHVRCIRAALPGKGRILTRCLTEARGSYVGFLDADLEIPVSSVGRLLAHLDGGVDAAIANKVDAGGRSLRRRSVTRLANALIRTLFGTRIGDHQAGCKLFRADRLLPVLRHVRSTGWLWDTEVLVHLVRQRGRVAEVAVDLRPVRRSRLSVRSLFESFLDVARLAYRLGPVPTDPTGVTAAARRLGATPWVS